MKKIGRFRVGRELGAGGQGRVYLCLDPELRRRVAIKLLDAPATGGLSQEQDFLREARSIGQIQHPNIVSLFDVGKQDGRPYLVFEYVEGELLGEYLKKNRPDLQTVLDLFDGMLTGIDRVHQRGIVHRDLKPSNIIISRDGVPKIMDFGISRMLASGLAKDAKRIGSPRYMAPEYITEGRIDLAGDVFALGAILYEMLTGYHAFAGERQQEVLDRICNSAVEPPSRRIPEVGEQLDAIVLKALEKQPSARYRDAGQLLLALQSYREQSEMARSGDAGEGKGTVEFLFRRMRHKRDFPVLSESIRTLNRLAASEEEDVSRLTRIIIRDYALTSKILKVVNSAYYSRFAGKIGSVSRAIVVLGMKTIRSIAASLIFFEHLHDKTQAARLRDQIAAAVFSATLARQVAEDAGLEDAEGSFLCAMLYDLGRILVTYYLPDEAEEIERLMAQEGMAAEHAQKKVLGMSFERMGIATAKQWNFPEEITHGMIRVAPEAPGNLKQDQIKIRLIAGFANEAAKVIGSGTSPKGLLRRYRTGLAVSDRRFEAMVQEARSEFKHLSSSFSGGNASPFLRLLADDVVDESQSLTEKSDGDVTQSMVLESSPSSDTPAPANMEEAKPSPDAERILTDGLQEVTAMLLDETGNLSQIFNVVLETIYRAMAFQRVLLGLQDVNRNQFTARLGFGADIERFMEHFRFPCRYSPNVFHVAMKRGVDLYIEDTNDRKIRDDIPGWYRNISHAGSFILFPLMVNRRALGLIYADHPHARGMQLSGSQLNLLKALRNQIVLGFRSRA